MLLKTFPGGIHPPESKHFTECKPIEDMPVPSLVVIPLQQHTGAPCEPLVKPGDEVKEGQKVGDSKSFVSAPLHSSISGRVTAIEPRPHPVIPKDVLSIVIEANSPQPTVHSQETGVSKPWTVDRGPSTESLTQLTPQQIKEKIREAGIVGLGGAAFPTHVKLSPPPEKKIDTVILNGCECEPYLTNDHQLMLEKPAEILEGLKIILKVLGINRAFIAIESNKPDAIEKLQSTFNLQLSTFNGIKVIPLRVKYPQGAEKQLIKAILNREVPGGGLPFDVGVIVQNVGTAFAVYEAVTSGKPLIERVITVTGAGIKEPKNLRVRIGTPVSRVVEYCGGLIAGASSGPDLVGTFPKIIMGGPMMGIAQYTLDVPVIKGTSGILALNDVKEEKEGPCIKCGRCVDICPMYLMPNRIGDYAEIDIFERCREFGIMDCMECGACAYVCASRRPLVHLIKYAKSRLAAAAKK